VDLGDNDYCSAPGGNLNVLFLVWFFEIQFLRRSNLNQKKDQSNN